jgi:hypothetical protein
MSDNDKMKNFLEYNSGEMRQSSSATLSVQVSHVITLAQILAVTFNRHISTPKCTMVYRVQVQTTNEVWVEGKY